MRNVVVTRCPIGAASEIALQKGFLEKGFAKAGAEVTVLQSLPPDKHITHFTHQAPLDFREGGNNPAIWAKSIGNETKLIGLSLINQAHAIIVSPDSDITEVRHLRGKKLSLPHFKVDRIDFWRSMVLRGYKTVLEAYGIGWHEVELAPLFIDEEEPCQLQEDSSVVLKFEKLPDTVKQHDRELKALRSGEIDAFFAHGTLVAEITDKKLGRVLIDISKTNLSNVNNIYPNTITVRTEFAERNPDLTVIFLAQLFAASEWAKENRDETLEISARGQYGVTVKQLDSVRDADFHKNLAPSFDHNLLELLRSQNKFLFDNGFIDKPVDIDAWIDESYIQKALEL